MTNAKPDKLATPNMTWGHWLRQNNSSNMTNSPRNHPTKQEYVCKCGAKADVWDSFDTYCASCYLAKQKGT